MNQIFSCFVDRGITEKDQANITTIMTKDEIAVPSVTGILLQGLSRKNQKMMMLADIIVAGKQTHGGGILMVKNMR